MIPVRVCQRLECCAFMAPSVAPFEAARVACKTAGQGLARCLWQKQVRADNDTVSSDDSLRGVIIQ